MGVIRRERGQMIPRRRPLLYVMTLYVMTLDHDKRPIAAG